MDGGEVLPRADKSRMLARNWLHFIFVVILVVGTVVGVATLQWGTLIKDVDPVGMSVVASLFTAITFLRNRVIA
jgi:hypothetical protein